MTGLLATTGNLSFELVVTIVAVSMIVGAVDLVRQPGWAWKRAEESKAAYFVLVLLVPLVGLGMYLHTARPKVKTIASAGRAASLPFESFGDDAVQAHREESWPVGTVLAAPERFGSFGATTVADGEIRLVDSPTRTGDLVGPGLSGGGGGGGTATATRTYRPTQRTSLPVPAGVTTPAPAVPPGWKADPTGRHQFRYWAGNQWTENVADNGEQSRGRGGVLNHRRSGRAGTPRPTGPVGPDGSTGRPAPRARSHR